MTRTIGIWVGNGAMLIKFNKMKNFEVLSTENLINVKGGRTVTKIDLTDDGKWNIKIVTRNDGTIVCKRR